MTDYLSSETEQDIRQSVRAVCSKFPDEYWMRHDTDHEFAWDFYKAMAEAGWLGICTPERYGGGGAGVQEAAVMMEEVSGNGGGLNAATMVQVALFGLEPIVKHGSDEQRQRFLPRAAAGDLQVCFAVTEPDAGTDTTSISTVARRVPGGYRVNGRKVFISRAQEAEQMLLITRTTPRAEAAKPSQGMTLFLAAMDPEHVEITPIPKLGRNVVSTNTLAIDTYRRHHPWPRLAAADLTKGVSVLGDLFLCASTIDQAGFRERVSAARAGGYTGIGMRPSHYQRAAAEGLTDSDLRTMLANAGLELVEIGFLAGWWETGERAARSRSHEERLYRLKETLGGRHMMLISGPLTDPVEAIAERFAGVCDRAAAHGLLVGMEFLPWTETRNAGTAWRIADLAGRTNGGVVLDTWHHFRGTADDDHIAAIPADRVIAVQFNDGELRPVGTDLEDTFRRRRLPGTGDFDLHRFVRLVEDMGVTAPIGVEVLSDELRALPAEEVARRTADATRSVLAEARSGPTTRSRRRAARRRARPMPAGAPGRPAAPRARAPPGRRLPHFRRP